MHRRFVAVPLLAALALSLPSLLPAADTAPAAAPALQPKAVIAEPLADLPPVIKGEKAIHDFVVKNEGTAPLQIDEVIPACGCTVTTFDKIIPPGGTGKIHAEISTEGISGGAAKTITVRTNDPNLREFILTVQVKVANLLEFNPGFARFTKGQGHPPGVVKEIFFSPLFDDLKILEVSSPFPALKVEYREALLEERRKEVPGKQYVFTLTFDYDKAEIGPIKGDLIVRTNHPKQEIARLPMSGFVRPILAVTPPGIDFGQLDLTQPATARFLLANFGEKALQVTSVEIGITGSDVSFRTAEEGRRYFVELKLPATMPKGPFSSELKIHTDSPKEPLVTVPVTGSIL